jgi:hypothetical protein
VGGHNGNNLASTVEIYDPRANSWRIGSPFSVARGYGCAVTMNDNLYLIGGVNDTGETVETVSLSGVTLKCFIFRGSCLSSNFSCCMQVEVYSEMLGWSISGCEAIGRRAFACAVVV